MNQPLHEFSADHLRCFRFLPANATYSPTSSYPASSGRFDNGKRLTLYVANDAEAAVAEYYRRHPELLPFQEAVSLRVFELELSGHQPLLDVRTEAGAAAAGIPFERLTSSDPDATRRYAECRALADRVEGDYPGIAWPTAAYSDSVFCIVLFGENHDHWDLELIDEIPTPTVDESRVRVIEAA